MAYCSICPWRAPLLSREYSYLGNNLPQYMLEIPVIRPGNRALAVWGEAVSCWKTKFVFRNLKCYFMLKDIDIFFMVHGSLCFCPAHQKPMQPQSIKNALRWLWVGVEQVWACCFLCWRQHKCSHMGLLPDTQVAHAPGMSGKFSPSQGVCDPDLHHGMCVPHVPWCMPAWQTSYVLWSRWRGDRWIPLTKVQ